MTWWLTGMRRARHNDIGFSLDLSNEMSEVWEDWLFVAPYSWNMSTLTMNCQLIINHTHIGKYTFLTNVIYNFSINQNSLKPITLWRYTVFNKKENVKINPNNSKFISICQMVWFSDIRLYKMWRAGKFLAEWLHWSVVRGNTKSKQVLMTYILICTIQFFTTFWKKKNSMEVWIIACNTYN